MTNACTFFNFLIYNIFYYYFFFYYYFSWLVLCFMKSPLVRPHDCNVPYLSIKFEKQKQTKKRNCWFLNWLIPQRRCVNNQMVCSGPAPSFTLYQTRNYKWSHRYPKWCCYAAWMIGLEWTWYMLCLLFMLYIYIYIYLSLYLSLSLYVYIYIYIYIYIYTHT